MPDNLERYIEDTVEQMGEKLINRLRDEILSEIRSLVRRAVISEATAAAVLKSSTQDGYPEDGVEHFDCFGFASRPPAGSECLQIAIGGDVAHSAAVCAHDPDTRPEDLESGEACMHNAFGDTLYSRETGFEMNASATRPFKIGSGSDASVLASALAQAVQAAQLTGQASDGQTLQSALVAALQGPAASTSLKID